MQINAKLYSWQIILNANALLYRNNKIWKKIENKLREVPLNYLQYTTSSVGEAKELIINLCRQGERHFLIVGGDGTLNAFVNAVMESQVDSTEIFAALIPMGTGNDWSRTHGYSNNYIDVIHSLEKGNFIKHDMGLVESIHNGKVIAQRYFVNIAGFGFDGEVIFDAYKKTKFFNKQLYLINLLKTLIAYKSQSVTIKSADFTATKQFFSIAAGICQYNGNGMRQCPEAIPDDGLLDVVMIEKVSIFKVLRNIKNLYKGLHVKKLKEVSMIRTNDLEINTISYLFAEAEGEMLTAGSFRIRCISRAIHLMCY